MSTRFDEALGRRLAKLGALPVDTTGLERRLRSALPARPGAGRWRRALRPLLAVAASLIVVLAVALPLMTGGREVRASAQMMAQLHDDLVSGKTPTMTADTVADANRMIVAMTDGSLTLPAMPTAQSMACCMSNVKDKQVACVLLKGGGEPVTMAVARASDMTAPEGVVIERGGQRLHVEQVGRLAMVSFERDGRFVCLMGAVPSEKLQQIAEALKF